MSDIIDFNYCKQRITDDSVVNNERERETFINYLRSTTMENKEFLMLSLKISFQFYENNNLEMCEKYMRLIYYILNLPDVFLPREKTKIISALNSNASRPESHFEILKENIQGGNRRSVPTRRIRHVRTRRKTSHRGRRMRIHNRKK